MKKTITALCLITTLFINTLTCMEIDPNKKRNQSDSSKQIIIPIPQPLARKKSPHNIHDILRDDAQWLKKLIARENSNQYCHNLCIAEETLQKNFKHPIPCFYYISKNQEDNRKSLSLQFGEDAVVLGHYIVERGEIRDSIIEQSKNPSNVGSSTWKHYVGSSNFKHYIANNQAALNVYADSPDLNGGTIVHYAAARKNDQFLMLVLANNGNPNALDKYLRTPLLLAIEAGSTQNVQMLLDKQADPNHQDADGNTPWHYVMMPGNSEAKKMIADILCLPQANPNIQNYAGNTPLHVALINNIDTSIIGYLLEYDTLDFSLHNNLGDSAIDIVTKYFHHTENATLIFDTLDSRLGNLFSCKPHTNCEKIKELVRYGANIEDCPLTFYSPLDWALKHRCKQCLQLLIDNKVDCNKINKHGYTPLAYTVSKQFNDGTYLLLNARARINKKGYMGKKQPLYYAITERHIATVEMLLKHGALVTHDILNLVTQRENTLQSIVNRLQTAYHNQNEAHEEDKPAITCNDILRYSTSHIKTLLKNEILVTDEIVQYAIACNFDMTLIVDILQAAAKKQSCCICFNNNQEAVDLWGYELGNIPCTEYHPHDFLCGNCHNLLHSEKKPCPICRRELQ